MHLPNHCCYQSNMKNIARMSFECQIIRVYNLIRFNIVQISDSHHMLITLLGKDMHNRSLHIRHTYTIQKSSLRETSTNTYSNRKEISETATTSRSSRLKALRQNDLLCTITPNATICIHIRPQIYHSCRHRKFHSMEINAAHYITSAL